MSSAQSRHLRMIGKGEPRRVEIEIAKGSPTTPISPYLPDRLSDPLHPGGNSLCYAVQVAHRMGAERIVATGFTLQNGSRYQHEGGNPVNRTELTRYGNTDMPLAWLRWYSDKFPGKLCLDATFSGPLYDSLPEDKAPRFRGK